MERHTYLELVEPQKAREIWFGQILGKCPPLGEENIALHKSGGRILSTPQAAKRSSPAFHGAAMDGIAVRAENTYGASPSNPLHLKINTDAFSINTGQPMPDGTNAVIMVENINYNHDATKIIIEKAAFPWQHVRKTGEDIVETEIILAPGTRIGPYEIGALAASGILYPKVFKKPRIAIIPTGSDLQELDKITEEELRSGKQLPEFNSLILSQMLVEAAAYPFVLPIAPDEPDAIIAEVQGAVDDNADLVIINAGTSAGTHDFSARVISQQGDLLVHGVSMMPGKPVALGLFAAKNKFIPIIGVPGYPVSACMAIEEFVLPLIALWQKQPAPEKETVEVFACNNLPSRPGMEERLRVKLGKVNDKIWAVPLSRGAGTVTSLSRADAILPIPANSEGIMAGEMAEAQLLRPAKTIENSLLAVGSHDNALDLVDGFLRREYPQFRLTSAHVGSLGGLLAIAKGQAHLAGSHLLDPETGLYNQKAITQFLENIPVVLIRLVNREQGLMVKPGNPVNIKSLMDLARPDIRFINRQQGSGTRVLLDYELLKNHISPDDINGYKDEEYTHMNVAQAIISDRADTGLGTKAAANALGLDFIPVGIEEYDLVIPKKFLEDEKVKALLEIISTEKFKEEVKKLGGYGTEKTGQIIWEYEGK